MKKCIICKKNADYCIKGTSNCYCKECARKCFADLRMLKRVEEEAKKLKKLVEEKATSIKELDEDQKNQ